MTCRSEVCGVEAKYVAQVPLAEDDDVVKAFSPDKPNGGVRRYRIEMRRAR